jgi:hypothetical protein
MNLPAIDKQAHFFSGACVSFTIAIALVPHMPELVAIGYGVVAALFAGLAKELWDHFHPATNTMDVFDFLATGLGGAAAGLILYLL